MKMTPKSILGKILRFVRAWETLRPQTQYAGLTLDQFKAAVQPSLDARDAIDDLETQLIAKQDQRDAADLVSLDACKKVVAGVRAVEGENSEVLEALGYVIANQRKSGLSRKGTETPKQS